MVVLSFSQSTVRRSSSAFRASFLQDAGMSGISLIELPYDPQAFYTAVKGLEAEPERGERCTVCYRLRM